jgi:hypothetical protein
VRVKCRTAAAGRALHSPTFRLDVSTLQWTRWVILVDFSDKKGSG